MPDIKYILPPTGCIAIPGNAITKLISAGSGDAALLYLYILTQKSDITVSNAARDLRKSVSEVERSMEKLCYLGLLSPSSEGTSPSRPLPADETPTYSITDISNELKNGSAFGALVNEVQHSFGKILSSDDLVKLFGIYNNLGLPTEVILILVNHCISEYHKKYGSNRLPTMRYIEKAAYTWEREEIFSIERAEQYLKGLELRRKSADEIKSALQIQDRDYTATEKKYVDKWISLGFSADAVEIAFDRTVTQTGKRAWGYMDSILDNWHSSGYHTSAQIIAGETKPTQVQKAESNRENTNKTISSFGDTPTLSDIERMKRMLDAIKNS